MGRAFNRKGESAKTVSRQCKTCLVAEADRAQRVGYSSQTYHIRMGACCARTPKWLAAFDAPVALSFAMHHVKGEMKPKRKDENEFGYLQRKQK